jgi:hypothetical protein
MSFHLPSTFLARAGRQDDPPLMALMRDDLDGSPLRYEKEKNIREDWRRLADEILFCISSVQEEINRYANYRKSHHPQ